ncbi:hypothetical protein [Serratia sp. 1D1416]|uniref:hypothetical protein n=1 Tax=Serratia sp. 1D1416 TaxID=2447890 RepID=UPI001013D0EF|nr:hypothetical protein [Serratia sp. 1D1416]
MSDETPYPDNSAKVLAFTKRFDENADIKEMRNFVEEDERLSRRCAHGAVSVSEHERKVTCRQCGAVIDSFDYLLALAKGETKLDWELRVLRGEIKQHREGLEKLKREEVNCKGRIKTAQFRLADVNRELVEAGDKLVSKKMEKGKS